MSRPAVTLSANTATSSSRLISSSTLLRCQNSRRNRQVQVSRTAITRIDSTTKPISRATSRPPSLSLNHWIASQATASIRSPLRTIVSPRSHCLLTSATPSAARVLAASVAEVENDELATTSGRINEAPSAVSGLVRSPANRLRIPSRIVDTSVSLSSARSAVSSTRAASARTAAQRSGVSPLRVSRSSLGSPPGSTSARSVARSSLGDPVAERRVDGRDVALELAQLLRRDRCAAGDREVVLEPDGGTRRVAGPLGQDLADVPLGARRL